MNIKSLLLGSAAALVAVSGARAADAIEVVAEPEPVEYVRVCDTYGTGYFYIPGTETCLRIGGYVRYDIRAGNGAYGGHEVADKSSAFAGITETNDTYHKQARLSLRTWTGTETDLGTLSTYTETRFNYRDGPHGGGTSASLNFAWIQLGGFRVGKDESVFTTFPGYAGAPMADDIVAYGPFDTNLISYTFDAGNGFSAIVSLETGETGSDYEIDSYMPHVVGGVRYAGGWGSITGVVGYDSVYEEFAGKVRLDVNVNEQLSLFAMVGYGSDDDWIYSNYKQWNGEWAAWVGGSYQINDKTSFYVQGSWSDGLPGFDEDWAVVAGVDYEIVKGFHIIPEVNYTERGWTDVDAPGGDGFGGWLRFQRSF